MLIAGLPATRDESGSKCVILRNVFTHTQPQVRLVRVRELVNQVIIFRNVLTIEFFVQCFSCSLSIAIRDLQLT